MMFGTRGPGGSGPGGWRTALRKRSRIPTAAVIAIVGVVFAGLLVVPLFFGAALFFYNDDNQGECSEDDQPSASAQAGGIPKDYLKLYHKAGKKYGLSWNLLAGIGKVETDHGRSTMPGVLQGENYAGAGGPMQFLEDTWKEYAVDGNGDGKKDRHDPEDAIPTAARYLKSSGAPSRTQNAIFTYNHSMGYVHNVLGWAERYGKGGVKVVQADSAQCESGGASSETVAKAIAFAMAQRGKPYVFGASGPDAWDCSSLIQGAYASVGITIPRTTFAQWDAGKPISKGKERPGDLVFFNSGPGTAPDNPGHVGLVIKKGKMVVARCTACRPAITVEDYRKQGDWVGVRRPDVPKKKAQGALSG